MTIQRHTHLRTTFIFYRYFSISQTRSNRDKSESGLRTNRCQQGSRSSIPVDESDSSGHPTVGQRTVMNIPSSYTLRYVRPRQRSLVSHSWGINKYTTLGKRGKRTRRMTMEYCLHRSRMCLSTCCVKKLGTNL